MRSVSKFSVSLRLETIKSSLYLDGIPQFQILQISEHYKFIFLNVGSFLSMNDE